MDRITTWLFLISGTAFFACLEMSFLAYFGAIKG